MTTNQIDKSAKNPDQDSSRAFSLYKLWKGLREIAIQDIALAATLITAVGAAGSSFSEIVSAYIQANATKEVAKIESLAEVINNGDESSLESFVNAVDTLAPSSNKQYTKVFLHTGVLDQIIQNCATF